MLLALLLALAQDPVPAAAPAPAADRRALLVGISRYARTPDALHQDLGGPPSDVALIRRLLVERFGFPPENVLVLLEEAATHEGILHAFADHLIAPSRPGTEALFYFSGHGSRVPDLSAGLSPEIHAQDNTLVCWDSARGADAQAPDLTDDEMRSLLTSLAARTNRITVITDCCNSGGLTRGGGRLRALEPGIPLRPEHRARLWPQELPFLDDDAPGRRDALEWIHVAACGADQEAKELPFVLPDGEERTHGVLTWYLAEALDETAPGASWEQVVARAAAFASADEETERQELQVAGPVRRMLFAGEFAPPPPGFAAVVQPDGESISVRAGSLHLLHPDSRFRILDGAEVLGEAVVARYGLKVTRCRARWTDPAPRVSGLRSVRAVPIGPTSARPPLALQAPDDPRVAALLEPALAAGLVRRVGAGQQAEMTMEAPHGGPWQLRDAATGYAPALLDPDGPTAAASLLGFLQQEQRYRALLELPPRDESGVLEVAWSAPTAAELQAATRRYRRDWRPARLGLEPEGAVAHLQTSAADQLSVLEVRLAPGPVVTRSYVTVLCVSEDRSVSLIFPTDSDRENVLESGESLRIPVELFIPPGWPAGRPQHDRYLVFGTTEYENLAPLVQTGAAGVTLRSGSRAPRELAGALAGAVPAAAGVPVRWSLARADLRLHGSP